jgi:tRNA (mo5U34)-methyltransferase
MLNFQPLYETLLAANAVDWVSTLPAQLNKAFVISRHGHLPKWQMAIDSLPQIQPSRCCLNEDVIQIGNADDLSEAEIGHLEKLLKSFMPWRKGPYELFGLYIDTEWRSDWKWRRLEKHIAPLDRRLVLDVGCGNGYHSWRMLGAQARMVIGIDPLLLNVMQFQFIRQIYGEAPIYVLPMGIEELPVSLKLFDTVFSMGVLYHRRSPIDHLLELKNCLRPGGELVLETLVINGDSGETLVPEDRYANMRNVWFIPSCATLISWMKRCGFENIRLVDLTVTTVEEQRSTEWMTFNSLKDFLNSDDPALTIEGLPSPKRAILLANSPI